MASWESNCPEMMLILTFTPQKYLFKSRNVRRDYQLEITVRIYHINLFIDLKEKGGPSSQIDFYTNELTARKDSRVVAMHHGWTSKKVSEMRFRDTHHQLFEGNDLKWNPNRADQLM